MKEQTLTLKREMLKVEVFVVVSSSFFFFFFSMGISVLGSQKLHHSSVVINLKYDEVLQCVCMQECMQYSVVAQFIISLACTTAANEQYNMDYYIIQGSLI